MFTMSMVTMSMVMSMWQGITVTLAWRKMGAGGVMRGPTSRRSLTPLTNATATSACMCLVSQPADKASHCFFSRANQIACCLA